MPSRPNQRDVATFGQSVARTRHPIGRRGRPRIGCRGQIGRFHPAPIGVRGDGLVAAGEAEQGGLRPGRSDELESDRQPVGQAARDRHTRQPGHVDGQRAGIRQVHRDRVGQSVTEAEGDRRRGRRDQRIEALRPQRVEVGLDQRPDLLRLQVVGVVVARRQGVRPEHDPTLDLRPEAPAAGGQVVREHVAVAEPRPEPDAVVAGQVRRGLGRSHDVVGRETVIGVRQADLIDCRTGRLEGRDGLADTRLDTGLHARHEILTGQAEPLAAKDAGGLVVVGRQGRQSGRNRFGRGRRIAIVAAGDGVEQGRRVARIPGERADLVERAGERDDPVAADPAVRRFHADDPAQRRRLADRAAGIRADRQRGVECRDRRCRAAAAAARHPVERPRVGGRTIGGVLGRGAHRELVHVGLAEDDRARLAEPLRDVGVVRRAISLQDPRSGRALATRQRDQVLERDRDAEQRPEQVERPVRIGTRRRQPGVRCVGLGQRPVAIDGQPDVERPVVTFRGREVGLGQFARRDLTRPQERGHLVGVQSREVGHRRVSARRGWPARR